MVKSGTGKELIKSPCPKSTVNYTQKIGYANIMDDRRYYVMVVP
jgi:hypothetical protein